MAQQALHRPPHEIAMVAGLAPLAPRYDLILCDVWGVLHDGLTAFSPASDALCRFRDKGGIVVLVSNAPRPGATVARQLDRLGVPRAAYDAIITSGDLTRAAVAARADEIVCHIGPPRDHAIFDGLGVRFGDVGTAAYVVCSGLVDDDRETAEDYRGRLEAMRARRLLMICANPDIVVERGERLVPCAGALAQLYGELGGEVYWAGKPHRPVYEAALDLAARLAGGGACAADRILAIGDAMRTDITGAALIGADSLFVARGIHAAEIGLAGGAGDRDRLSRWLAAQPLHPTAVTETLTWSGPAS